jgi:hypothetical protein
MIEEGGSWGTGAVFAINTEVGKRVKPATIGSNHRLELE